MNTGSLCLEHEALKITQCDVAEAMTRLADFANLITDAIVEVRPDIALLSIREGNFIHFRMASR
jgi:hypothetical protein